MSSSETPHPASPPRNRYVVLGVLVLVYTLNYLDRQILGILAGPIKKELALTDGQLGLMGGLSFALLYSTMGVPIAWLADRKSRSWIMTVCLAAWSLFTAVCGLAGNFWHLFLARIGVGVGEAGGAAPAYSLISDYFPKAQRGRALATYSLGIPIGSGLGVLLGGLIAASIGWRAAFMVVGGAGVLLAPIFKLVVRDPVRGGLDADPAAPAAPKPASPTFREVLRTVLPKASFWLLALGAASSSICGYGVAFWLPSFFQRSLHLTLVQTAWFYGAINVLGGVLGIVGGGALADILGKRSRANYARIPAVAFLVAMPLFFAAINTRSLTLSFFLFVVPTGLNLAWLGPVISAVQQLAPASMRSTVSALFLLVNNLLGIAVGYYYFGAMSDLLRPMFGEESLRYAIYSGGGFYLLSSTLLLFASRSLPRDWVE